MYSNGQMGWSFSISDAWDGLRRYFTGDDSVPDIRPTGGALSPGYHPDVTLPWPVNDLVAAGANVTDIDDLATISDWAASVVAAGRVPSRERIPQLHAGELASRPTADGEADTPAPDAVREADKRVRGKFGAKIDQLLVVHQYTALPANVGPLAAIFAGGPVDTTSLLKWGAIALSAFVLVPVLLDRNPPSRARRRRRR